MKQLQCIIEQKWRARGGEEKKPLIALWSEEALQNEFNTMRNKKLVWDKISQGMTDAGYSRNV